MPPTPQERIAAYFKNLSYPEITECQPVLYGKHGDVYLIKFEKKRDESTHQRQEVIPPDCKYPIQEGPTGWKTEPSTIEIPIPNAYAIVIGDTVSGYNEDFWSDADKYRLVLKQHLGMLVMEAVETAPVAKPVEVKPDAPPNSVRPETMDAVVARYEEMIAKLYDEAEQVEQRTAEKLRALSGELEEMNSRLSNARKALNGELGDLPKSESVTAESTAIAQDEQDPYGIPGIDDLPSVATPAVPPTKREVPCGMYSDIPNYIPAGDKHADYPGRLSKSA